MLALSISDLSKTFAGHTVLHRVSLTVKKGEVHALVGQNGSGKSTFIKVLAGYHSPDDGATAQVHGEPLDLGSAGDADRLNLRFVHQDLGLVDGLSITENVMLGRHYPRRSGVAIDWAAAHSAVDVAIRRTGPALDVHRPVGELGVSDRTRVAISRALPESDAPAVLVLDEPTAALPEADVRELFGTIRRLAAAGHSVVLVTHHLDEVLGISDRVTVLRDGRRVDTVATRDMTTSSLTRLIIGSDLVKDSGRLVEDTSASAPLGPVLEVRDLSGGPIHAMSFGVGAGEIVGVAGLSGSGREHIATMISGAAHREGEITLSGRVVPVMKPRAALDAGMAWVYGERAKYGTFSELDVRSNLTMGSLSRHTRFGRIDARKEQREVESWITDLGIVTSGPRALLSSLSGGNQQKVLVARALRLDPTLLLLDDPTAGIDVGAREQVHHIIERQVNKKTGVLMTSSDSDELARICDRVLIVSRGVIVAELHRAHGLTAHQIDHAQVAGAAA